MRRPPVEVLEARLARLRQALTARSCDAVVVANASNRAYLSGVPSSAGVVLVTSEDVVCLTDGRYAEVMGQAVAGRAAWRVDVSATGQSLEAGVVAQAARRGLRRLAIEADHISLSTFRCITGQVRDQAPQMDLEPTSGLVEGLRSTKDAWEIDRLRDSAARLSEVMKSLMTWRLEGESERGVAGRLEAGLRAAGFDRPAFDTIVAAGPHAAHPHHRPGDRRIAPGDLVVVDVGGLLDGYASDMTRTLPVGRVPAEFRKWLEVVAEAQEAAYRAARPGQQPSAVDRAARTVLERAGLADAFSHATGHGLGLDVHERPRVGPARSSETETPLAPRMVFTLEPGLYRPGLGGVRIEDDILLTSDGPERLTDAPQL